MRLVPQPFLWMVGRPADRRRALMKRLGRRSPTIINAAYGLIFMWDGRADTLEEQALGPIQADVRWRCRSTSC